MAQSLELRRQLADRAAKKFQDLAIVRTDQAKPDSDEVPDEILEKIIKALMTKTGADRADIEVIHAESLTFGDGSLGCGRPGQVYTHAPVSGYRLILGHAGQQFDYRATEHGFFVLCEQPAQAAPGASIDPPVQ